jgi:hypothetical protein
MKTITHFNTARDKLLHIETEGCIINVRVGLQEYGTYRNVIAIEVLPNITENWNIDDTKNTGRNIRIIKNG